MLAYYYELRGMVILRGKYMLGLFGILVQVIFGFELRRHLGITEFPRIVSE